MFATLDSVGRRRRLILLAGLTGIGNEIVAGLTSVWVYSPGWLAAVNVVVMFCGVMAWIAYRWFDRGPGVLFAIGAAVGIAYELFNAYVFRMWAFPGDRFLAFHGYFVISLVIGLMWGLVPMLCAEVEGALERRLAAAPARPA